MIRVLQILPGLDRGGMETFIMNVYRKIDRTNIQFDFLVNTTSGDYFEEIINLGGHIISIPSRRHGYKHYIKSLNSFFKENATTYKAVHYHESSLTSLEPLWYAKKYGIKCRIIHSHSSKIKGNKLHFISHFFGKTIVSYLATDYLGCSDKAIKWMFGYTGIKSKAKLIANGIDTDAFAFNIDYRKRVRNILGLDDKKILGHVGRFMEVKNHKFLLRILASLLRIEPQAHLVLVGTGELENNIKNLAEAMGLTEHISFLGVRTDINLLMQAMDVFVMPSLYEGLPVVLVEAQASGLPVICSDTISKMSKITPFYYSCSIEKGSDEWAELIMKVLESKIDRSKSKLQISEAGFDILTTVKVLISIYVSNES